MMEHLSMWVKYFMEMKNIFEQPPTHHAPPQEILDTPECQEAGTIDVWDCEELLKDMGLLEDFKEEFGEEHNLPMGEHEDDMMDPFHVPPECETDNGPLDKDECDALLRDMGLVDKMEDFDNDFY